MVQGRKASWRLPSFKIDLVSFRLHFPSCSVGSETFIRFDSLWTWNVLFEWPSTDPITNRFHFTSRCVGLHFLFTFFLLWGIDYFLWTPQLVSTINGVDCVVWWHLCYCRKAGWFGWGGVGWGWGGSVCVRDWMKGRRRAFESAQRWRWSVFGADGWREGVPTGLCRGRGRRQWTACSGCAVLLEPEPSSENSWDAPKKNGTELMFHRALLVSKKKTNKKRYIGDH